MSTYAIGDVQGCFDELQELLKAFKFQKKADRLWLLRDLVNRGPKSLEVLRFVRDLGDRAVTVLGNHDLHLVSEHEGFDTARKGDTFDDVLNAPDRNELRRGAGARGGHGGPRPARGRQKRPARGGGGGRGGPRGGGGGGGPPRPPPPPIRRA